MGDSLPLAPVSHMGKCQARLPLLKLLAIAAKRLGQEEREHPCHFLLAKFFVGDGLGPHDGGESLPHYSSLLTAAAERGPGKHGVSPHRGTGAEGK